MPKSIQASVTLLENLDIIVDKSPPDDLQTEILPMLYSSFESTTLQVQVALAIDYTSNNNKSGKTNSHFIYEHWS